MKILIIEDDADAACLLRELLAPEHDVMIAYTGAEAIELGRTFRPALIISDWNLNGEVDGVSACKQILEQHTATVIFVSGSPLDQLKEVAAALAPLHVLSKPIDIENLTALISELETKCKNVN